MSTPTDAAERKALPLCTGVLDYFPDALQAVAECSRVGNEQHNPGQPLHWAKEKSTDEADALVRHLLDRGTLDTDGVRHSAKVAWRALAMLQRELDAEAAAATFSIADIIKSYEDVRCPRCGQSGLHVCDPANWPRVTYMGMDLSKGESYSVEVEDWGTGDGPIFRLGTVTDGLL
jgi:hypothetical protein